MRWSRTLVGVAVATALTLIVAACSSGSSGASGDLSGAIVVSGSSTVEPITSLVAEKFQAQNPDVTPSVDGPGSSDGFALFCNGETDIADASRQISEEEIAACKKSGIDYVGLEVGLDGLSVIGNPSNPIDCLNFGDLYSLFGPESGKFSSWSDANALAEDVGGNGGFPGEDLVVVAPGEESGTYGSFIDLAIKDIAEQRNQPTDQLRAGYQSSADDNVIVDSAAGTTGGLGFVGLAYALNAGGAVKEFKVDGGSGCVSPSSETVVDGSYPLARSLFIYVNQTAAAEKPQVKAFVDYYLSDEGLASVEEVQYVPLPADRVEATRAAWKGGSAA